jgi:hypothetical protein
MTDDRLPSHEDLQQAMRFLGNLRTLMSGLLAAIYGGRPDGRPSSDADQLRAVAQMLDEVDDAMNAYLRSMGEPELVLDHPSMQDDLRRIADSLGALPGWGRVQ